MSEQHCCAVSTPAVPRELPRVPDGGLNWCQSSVFSWSTMELSPGHFTASWLLTKELNKHQGNRKENDVNYPAFEGSK